MPFALNEISHEKDGKYESYNDPLEDFLAEAGLTGEEDFLRDSGFMFVPEHEPEVPKQIFRFQNYRWQCGRHRVYSCLGWRYTWCMGRMVCSGRGKIYRLTRAELEGTWLVNGVQCTFSNVPDMLKRANANLGYSLRAGFFAQIKEYVRSLYDKYRKARVSVETFLRDLSQPVRGTIGAIRSVANYVFDLLGAKRRGKSLWRKRNEPSLLKGQQARTILLDEGSKLVVTKNVAKILQQRTKRRLLVEGEVSPLGYVVYGSKECRVEDLVPLVLNATHDVLVRARTISAPRKVLKWSDHVKQFD